MRIVVDMVKCESNGLCVAQAPDHFELTDDDELIVRADVVDPDQFDKVRSAARMCPKQAITVED
jgi:ferredoxin